MPATATALAMLPAAQFEQAAADAAAGQHHADAEQEPAGHIGQ